MKKIILKTNIKREVGKLYFCSADENGFLQIGEVEMRWGKGKGKRKDGTE